MLGDHAKSPFEVVPDALNGCAHRVGVIPRFLPFLPPSPLPPPRLFPSVLILFDFSSPHPPSTSLFLLVVLHPFLFHLPPPFQTLLFLTSHFPSLSTLIPLSSSTRLPASLYLPLRLFFLSPCICLAPPPPPPPPISSPVNATHSATF